MIARRIYAHKHTWSILIGRTFYAYFVGIFFSFFIHICNIFLNITVCSRFSLSLNRSNAGQYMIQRVFVNRPWTKPQFESNIFTFQSNQFELQEEKKQ